MIYENLLIHIPHSSVAGLDNSGWPTTADFMKEVDKWTDWATDTLFDFEALNTEGLWKIHTVKFPLSRFVLDVERLPDDPLEAKGQGRIYHQFEGHQRTVSAEEAEILLQLYDEHLAKIRSCLTPRTLLIDCHSFPSELSDVDVCIGYNEDWSRPSQETIDLIADAFAAAGYKVVINSPYSNSISPACGFPYDSVMIELNKRTYWDEQKLQLTDGAEKIHSLLLNLCVTMLGQSCTR